MNGTKNLELPLTVNSIGTNQWYVDASYAIHADCEGHTGTIMTMGGRAVISFSWKQKINAKSSMEAELIGIDDALPQVLWTQYFLECQEYGITSNIIYQDDKSTMVLKHRGKEAGSKQTKHVEVRCFLLKIKLHKRRLK